jgi:hypothetical protein
MLYDRMFDYTGDLTKDNIRYLQDALYTFGLKLEDLGLGLKEVEITDKNLYDYIDEICKGFWKELEKIN